jgi:hypothetical protein
MVTQSQPYDPVAVCDCHTPTHVTTSPPSRQQREMGFLMRDLGVKKKEGNMMRESSSL